MKHKILWPNNHHSTEALHDSLAITKSSQLLLHLVTWELHPSMVVEDKLHTDLIEKLKTELQYPINHNSC